MKLCPQINASCKAVHFAGSYLFDLVHTDGERHGPHGLIVLRLITAAAMTPLGFSAILITMGRETRHEDTLSSVQFTPSFICLMERLDAVTKSEAK